VPARQLVVLDSLEATNSTPGLLGEEQRAWLARALDENSDKPALVVVHHNLTPPGDSNPSLKDSEQLLEIIRPRRHVKAYIFGHTHDWGIKQDASGIHLVNLPPTAYVFTEGKPAAGSMPPSSGTAPVCSCIASTRITQPRARGLTLNGARDESEPGLL